MKEIEEAIIILRQRKQRQEPNFDFLIKVDDEKAQSKKMKRQRMDFYLDFYRSKSATTGIRKSIS